MYAKYAYNSGITQAQLLSDIVLLLTGTTSASSLSAACDTANTTISTAYSVAGWEVHDAASGTNAQVLKAPCEGDATQYKYVQISTVNAGYVGIGLWESWNAGTHVGTNQAVTAAYGTTSGNGQRYATAAAGVLHIFASNRRLVIFGISSAGNGSSSYSENPTFIIESARGISWNAVGEGFVPAVIWPGETNRRAAYWPRAKNAGGTTFTENNASGVVCFPVGQIGSSGTITTANLGSVYWASSGTIGVLPTYPLVVQPNSSGVGAGSSLSDPGGIYLTIGIAVSMDETSIGGITYIALPNGSALAAAPKILVPKG